MRPRILTLLCGVYLLSSTQVHAQDPPKREQTPVPTTTPDARSMIQGASDLRKASESLVQLASILEKVTPIVAQAAVDTSHEMAMMSDGFDPFGFKASYRVIHEQNKVIQEQNEIIRKLQQQEILRLRMELKKERERGDASRR